MNRRAVKPLLASAVMVLATFFALLVLTPSHAEEIPGTGTTSPSATATTSASATATATATASNGKNCGDCQRPGD